MISQGGVRMRLGSEVEVVITKSENQPIFSGERGLWVKSQQTKSRCGPFNNRVNDDTGGMLLQLSAIIWQGSVPQWWVAAPVWGVYSVLFRALPCPVVLMPLPLIAGPWLWNRSILSFSAGARRVSMGTRIGRARISQCQHETHVSQSAGIVNPWPHMPLTKMGRINTVHFGANTTVTVQEDLRGAFH